VNRVTVYRILDILVEKELLERISGGGRAFRYGMAPNANHQPHPHFYCRHCGNMECLNPESIHVDTDALQRTFPGLIQKVEIRVDGLCKSCLRLQQKNLA
jgi:Fur family ferric uptake transcriptional regulator